MRPSLFFARPFRTLLGFDRAPLLSFTKDPPLHRHRHRTSSPRDAPAYAVPSPSIGRYHRANPFRPRRFSRPRRFTPYRASQVYCTLLPVMGSARFQAPPFLPKRLTEASPLPSQFKTLTEVILSILPSHSPRFLCLVRRPCTAPAEAREKEQGLSPRAHLPFEAFPSNSAVPGSPSHDVLPHRSMPPPGLPLSSLFGASFLHVPPQPLPVLTFPGVQVTSLNHKGLSRARVRCTSKPFPTYPCPLLPWASQAPVLQCPSIMRSYPKSKIENRTETRPDAPTLDGRGPRSSSSPKASPKAFTVPTSSSHPADRYSRSCTRRSSYWYQVCGVP